MMKKRTQIAIKQIINPRPKWSKRALKKAKEWSDKVWTKLQEIK